MQCAVCRKAPAELKEYVEATADYNEGKAIPISADQYVRLEEGTFNPDNELFACTLCYIKNAMPAQPFPDRWQPIDFIELAS